MAHRTFSGLLAASVLGALLVPSEAFDPTIVTAQHARRHLPTPALNNVVAEATLEPRGDFDPIRAPKGPPAQHPVVQGDIDLLIEQIRSSEYEIRFQPAVDALQSPNRAQDLRITYHADGFTLTPRVESDTWRSELRLKGIGRGTTQLRPGNDAAVVVDRNTASVDHGTFVVNYTNDEAGMRQDFVLKERPDGDGNVTVHLEHQGPLHASAQGPADVLFSAVDESTGIFRPVVWYRDLKAWDADGDALTAQLSVNDRDITISVNDAMADYPITIDPLSTTANWSVTTGQLEAELGVDVGTAGDVNNDGYSDVIVGANRYDGASANQGAAFVYHGSATGLSTTPNWSRTGQAGSNFGISVSTAGDINGDGYSDVVVGAPEYTNTVANEGAALVYLGSATGLGITPVIFASGEAGSRFGFSVATAGDVNGNDVSDLIVGAYEDNGPLGADQGRVFVYHGTAAPAVINTVADWTMQGADAENHLGFNVSSAGDVNNDGYSDIIIGEPQYSEAGQVWEGRALVFLGSAGGVVGATLAAAAWTAEADLADAGYGNCVSFAGDVNGDGFGDVLVGGSGYGDGTTGLLNQGVARLYLGNATDVTNAFSWETFGPAAQAAHGIYLDCAGDVNGDGYADVIVGASRFDIFRRGSAHLYMGSAAGVGVTAAWNQTGGTTFERYGYCVGTAGDVNGDGYSDLIAGAPWAETAGGPSDEGRAFVYHGSPNGLAVGGTRDGGQDNAFLGTSVSTAGDVNGDGYHDVIIGAPQYDNGQTNEGRAFVYHGAAGGLGLSASTTIENNIAAALLGSSVSTAGDVNGDGYSDVIIGAPGTSNGQAFEGLAYLYYGSSAGLGGTPWIAERNLVNTNLGNSVSSAGDVNGDGYSDIIIGAHSYNVTQPLEGAAFVHFGSATGPSATPSFTFTQGQSGARVGACVAGVGDVTGDGYGDVLVGATGWTSGGLTGRGRAFLLKGHPTGIYYEPAWVMEGSSTGSQLGFSVSAAGDVNGDGITDLLIGEPLRPNGAVVGAGRAQCFYGAGLLPSTTAAWTGLGTTTNSRYGYAVSMAGDVNGDGYGDVVIGCPFNSNGTVHIHHGSPTGLAATANVTYSSVYSGAQFGSSVSNSGSTSGDGFGDVVVGAPGFDGIFVGTDRGRAQLLVGNDGITRSQRTRQFRADGVTPVQPSNGIFETGCGWTVSQIARSYLGRRKMRLRWETRPHGPAYSGSPITNSNAFTAQEPAWTAVNAAAGVELKETVTLSPGAYPKWRARLRHHPATMIDGHPVSRWFYMGIHDDQETAIKTNSPACGLLPVELIAFTAKCANGSYELNWTTASETNNEHFTIWTSENAVDWQVVDDVPGRVQSSTPTDYRYHHSLNTGAPVRYYRLEQTDQDGRAEILRSIAVAGCTASTDGSLQLYPNPSSGPVTLVPKEPITGDGLQVICHDLRGRAVRTHPASPTTNGSAIGFDPEGLAPGLYVIHLALGGRTVAGPVQLVLQ